MGPSAGLDGRKISSPLIKYVGGIKKTMVVPLNIEIADKSLARPGRIKANVSVRMA